VRSFLEHLEQCERADEKVWFLTPRDYAGSGGPAFAWNEWRRWNAKIRGCGDRTTISARSGTAPSAGPAFGPRRLCDLAGVRRQGVRELRCVVQGYAPEFRETSTVCRSFDELLEQIKALEHGAPEGELPRLIMPPHEQRWLKSEQDRNRRANRIGWAD
jgi:hypothetical protein